MGRVYPRVCRGTNEAHASFPAARLGAEADARGVEIGGGVERAVAKERRWELETALIGEFGLTLPPQTEPLNESRRADPLQKLRSLLRKAHMGRVRAKWLRILRCLMTLGLCWK